MSKKWDERLVRTAEQLVAAGESSNSLAAILKRSCRKVHEQIVRDRQTPELLELWGESVNFDEHAQQEIVHPAVLKVIGELAGVPMDGDSVHAGLQHTYGYLFSLIDTPYGYKRERWVETGLEAALGVHPQTIGPGPVEGTLFANLTYLLGRIAFRGRPKEIRLLRRHRHLVSQELINIPFRKLHSRRIIERISRKTGRRKQNVSIQTDVVRIEPLTLLVYSLDDTSNELAKLITAFTVTEAFAEELLCQPTGKRVQIHARFNAFIEGLSEKSVLGMRTTCPLLTK